MVEHVGQGCGLSFLIVAVFAVLLHERETVPPSPATKCETPAVAVVDPPRPANPPATRSPLVVTTPPSAEASTHSETKCTEARAESAPPIKVATAAQAPPKPAPTGPTPPAPRPHLRNPESDFTQVGVGETMESIATRVYGSIEAVETLWRSNRDQVVAKGRPLEPGTWLRTPPCPDLQARLGRR